MESNKLTNKTTLNMEIPTVLGGCFFIIKEKAENGDEKINETQAFFIIQVF